MPAIVFSFAGMARSYNPTGLPAGSRQTAGSRRCLIAR